MLGIDVWLGALPPLLIYLVVAGIILTESMGIPIPGEITLVSAALLAATGVTNIWWVATAAAIGAIIGDSIGYYIGHRGGRPLLERFGRRFPKHFGPPHLARAEKIFQRWGVWAVFFGRFVALLRILAGPLAGALRVPYRRFLVANASRRNRLGVRHRLAVIYAAGRTAEHYLQNFSWVALAVAILTGIASTLFLRRRAARRRQLEAEEPATTDAAGRGRDRRGPSRPAGPALAPTRPRRTRRSAPPSPRARRGHVAGDGSDGVGPGVADVGSVEGGAGRSGRGAAGSSTENVAPPRSLFAATTVPPCSRRSRPRWPGRGRHRCRCATGRPGRTGRRCAAGPGRQADPVVGHRQHDRGAALGDRDPDPAGGAGELDRVVEQDPEQLPAACPRRPRRRGPAYRRSRSRGSGAGRPPAGRPSRPARPGRPGPGAAGRRRRPGPGSAGSR